MVFFFYLPRTLLFLAKTIAFPANGVNTILLPVRQILYTAFVHTIFKFVWNTAVDLVGNNNKILPKRYTSYEGFRQPCIVMITMIIIRMMLLARSSEQQYRTRNARRLHRRLRTRLTHTLPLYCYCPQWIHHDEIV